MSNITKNYISFFKDLAANNNRDWFLENKKRYEKDVKKPFTLLVQEVIEKMQKLDPEIKVEPKDCIFRINRDIRFSKDKTPYKLHMSAGVSRGGKKDHSSPGIYWQMGPEELAIAGGVWEPDKAMLAKIRDAIVADPKGITSILNGKIFKETFGDIGGEDKYKILPKPFKELAPDLPILYNKSFHYWAKYSGAKHITQDNLANVLVDHYKIASKYNEWLKKAIN